MDKIDRFLLNFSSQKTVITYKSGIKGFFKVIKKDPDSYFDTKQDYEADVLKYWQSLKGRPPKTVRNYITSVKMLLRHYKIDLPQSFWETIRKRTKGSRAVTRFRVPTNKELKQILYHGDIKARALYLLLSSSGMRIGEVLQLEPSDIDIENNTIYIRAEYTKTGNRRTSFMTDECKGVLQEWLKHRDEHLELGVKRVKALGLKKSRNDTRIFPYNYNTAQQVWKRLLEKAGLHEKDERTGITRMNLHSLRKFFRSRLALSIPVDVVEAILGHEGYLTEVYRRLDDNSLREEYMKGQHNLLIFESDSADERIEHLEKEIEKRDNELGELTEKLVNNEDEIIGLQKQLNSLQEVVKGKKISKERPAKKETEIHQIKKQLKAMMEKMEELEKHV